MSGLPHGGAPLLAAETADAAVQQRRAEMLSRVDVASRAQQQLAQLRVTNDPRGPTSTWWCPVVARCWS